jgi:biopolymer transport protein ExbD
MGLKRRQRVEPEFSLAAMIDVIFLLLMFFMLTSNFVTPSALNLSLPSSSSKTMASPELTVEIKGEQYAIAGDKGAGRIIQKAQLEAEMAARVKALGGDPKTHTVTIAADESTLTKELVYVLNIANRLKVKTILKTKPEDTN